jgi:hypothetical protein
MYVNEFVTTHRGFITIALNICTVIVPPVISDGALMMLLTVYRGRRTYGWICNRIPDAHVLLYFEKCLFSLAYIPHR